MPKTFEQYYAESGQQSYLDELMRTGKYTQEKAKFEAGQTPATAPTPATFSAAAITGQPQDLAPVTVKPTKPFDQYMAESGQQSTLDELRRTGQYDKAKSQYESGVGQFAQPSPQAETGTVLPPAQAVMNLPKLYESLTAESGVGVLEEKFSKMEKSFIEAKGQINDNPFLSEATRVGRVAKLEKLFAERTANIRGEIATKKADVETKLNLQLKQFDIQSEQTRLAWDQFSTLLSAGALQNASGEDIANITRSTGISSTMIRSAIKAQVKEPEINSQLIQTDDGTNIRATLINKDTGEIISSQIISASKPRAPRVGTATERRAARDQQIFAEVQQELFNVGGEDRFVSPNQWNYFRQQWIGLGLSGKDFDDAFRTTFVGDPESRGFKSSEFGVKQL